MRQSTDRIETLRFDESEGIPNHPSLPVLLYRGAFDPSGGVDLANAIEERFRENNWTGCWRWGVYDFHHFHSNAHEVLGVARGGADLRLGGPDGSCVRVEAGDVVVLPAGTGHKNEGASSDFLVVGAYPRGQENKDLIRIGEAIDDDVRERIRKVPLPEADPLTGKDGTLAEEWGLK